MNLLFVSCGPPWPVTNGHDLRVYQLSRAVASGHRVTMLCPCDAPPVPETTAHLNSVLSRFEAVPVPPLPPPSRRSLARRLFGQFGTDLGASRFIRMEPVFAKRLEEVVRTGGFDVVWVASWFMLRYLGCLGPLPHVVDVVDDPTLYSRRAALTARGLMGRLRAFRDWRHTRALERRLFPSFGHAATISEVDAGSLRGLCPGLPVTVIPNGVDTEYFSPERGQPSPTPLLLFTGVMDYPPNESAALFFARDMLPEVRQAFPEAVFRAVGRNPSPRLLDLAKEIPGLEVPGGVPDLRPHFSAASLFVCPLVSGAGMKNKILEAWAMGKAVVATSLSCEGIDVQPGEDILVADGPAAFTHAVLTLLRDPERCRRMGEAGRKKAEERYSWSAQGERVIGACRAAAEDAHDFSMARRAMASKDTR